MPIAVKAAHGPTLWFTQMLNNIANDLDMLLSDLCQIYPYTPPKQPANNLISDDKLLEEYISGAGTSTSSDSGTEDLRERRGSTLSSQLTDSTHIDDSDKSIQLPEYEKPATDPSLAWESKIRPITTLERLTKTHPIWFLTEIGRMGAVHLLKDRQAGTFIVRRSSQNETWALSVQSPSNGNANIDHYLIESSGKGLRLQGSTHYFPAIPNLVAHYCDHVDELPLRLELPAIVLKAKTPQELMSLALLGQAFWTSPVTIQAEKLARLHSEDDSSNMLNQGLHKSVSEPISIKKSLEKSPPMVKSQTTVPSHSANTVSTFMTGRKPQQSTDFQRHNFSPPQTINSSQTLKSPKLNGSHVAKSSDRDPFQSVSGTNSCDRKFWKDRSPNRSVHTGPPFQGTFVSSQNFHSPKAGRTAATQTSVKRNNISSKDEAPALYGTTTLDFLTPPFPGYYSSNLSDRMSDYYDVWKNTVPTPTPRRKDLDTNFNETSDFGQAEKRLSSMDLNVTGKPPLGPQSSPTRLERQQLVFGQAEVSKPPKVRPPPLPTPRFKSSSIPSLNGFKSPVYSQPFDALCDSPGHGSCDDLQITANRPHPKRGLRRQRSLPPRSLRERRRQRSPHIPKLDPILSPSRLTSTNISPDGRPCEARDLPGSRADFLPNQRPLSSPCMTDTSPVITCRGNSTFYVTYPMPIKTHGNRVPPSSKCFSDSAIVHKQSKATYDETCLLIEDLEKSVKLTPPPISPSLNKFPVDDSSLINRHSFSDWSTVEDLISHTAPQCSVKPLQPLTLKSLQRVSQYDNMRNPYRASSVQTASSVGTEFCKPWDSAPWQKLLTSDSPVPTNGTALLKLPIERSVPEKILAWQDANNDYQRLAQWDEPATPHTTSESPVFGEAIGSSTSTLTQDCDMHFVEGSTGLTHTRDAGCLCKRLSCDQCGNESDDQCLEDTLTLPLAGYVDMEGESADDLPLPIQETAHNMGIYQKQQLCQPRFVPMVSRSKFSGVKVREYIYRISQDEKTTFGSTISNFIQCTKESKEDKPQIVMRNVRQFMNGIKNYLIKHGEGELEALIEKEREKLEANEILNLDAIIEGALHKCVIHPLKNHIYKLFVEQYNHNGNLKLLSDNIKYARTKSTEELGIKSGLSTPKSGSLEVIKQFLSKMQKAYSPLKKLENLLGATSTIYHSVQSNTERRGSKPSLGADDFLPMFIYVLVHCGLVAAEIEAEYMWGLLHPSLLTGEGGYYLTTLSSAVLILKNIRSGKGEIIHSTTDSKLQRTPSRKESSGFLRVVVPHELHGNISWQTLPLRANMTTRDACTMLAHKLKVTNPQDYGLYLLNNGSETFLSDGECPETARLSNSKDDEDTVLAYKRLAANIAWPKTFR